MEIQCRVLEIQCRVYCCTKSQTCTFVQPGIARASRAPGCPGAIFGSPEPEKNISHGLCFVSDAGNNIIRERKIFSLIF